jgi:hypothetical protein
MYTHQNDSRMITFYIALATFTLVAFSFLCYYFGVSPAYEECRVIDNKVFCMKD